MISQHWSFDIKAFAEEQSITFNINKRKNGYRQMGELWTLLEFACSLSLTCNMVLVMDGGKSRFLLCIMIFSILRLYGVKFSMN